MSLTLFITRFIPESARWLIARGHLDEAQTVLESYGGKNKSVVDSQVLRAVIEKIRGAQVAREQNSKKHSLIDLLRTPKLRKWTLIICYQWYVDVLFSKAKACVK